MTKFSELINGEQPVLVDFYAEWCGPCKAMAPELSILADKLKGKAKIVKVDVDKNQQAAVQYKVQGVPTLILFKNGEIKWRQSGAMGASQIEKVIMQNV